MNNIISAIILGIAANLDNFILSATYGMNKIQLSWKQNIVISSITAIFTIAILLIGNIIFNLINIRIANIIGALSLIIIGAIYLYLSLIKKDDYTICKKNRKFNLRELTILAVFLSLNNLPPALAISIAGINIFIVASIFCIFSILLLYLGSILGNKITTNYSAYSSIISSLLIIFLGIFELLY